MRNLLFVACVTVLLTQSASGGIISITERNSFISFINQAGCQNAFPVSTSDFEVFDVARSGACNGISGGGQVYSGDFEAAHYSEKPQKSEILVSITSRLDLDVIDNNSANRRSGTPQFRIFNNSRFDFTVDENSAGQIEVSASVGPGSQPIATLEADGTVLYDSTTAQPLEPIFLTPGVNHRWVVDGDLDGGLSPFTQGATITARLKIEEDADGLADFEDNCIFIDNPFQQDTDNDGIGNICDADLNNDCVVNAIDLGLFRERFFTDDPDADFNSDNIVNVLDLGILRAAFFSPPGESGVPNICD